MCIQQVTDNLYSINNVLDSCFIEYDGTMLVALRLKPIYLKSEKEQIIKTIQDYFFENFNVKEVIITLDSDLFYKVKNAKSLDQTIQTINIARSRI